MYKHYTHNIDVHSYITNITPSMYNNKSWIEVGSYTTQGNFHVDFFYGGGGFSYIRRTRKKKRKTRKMSTYTIISEAFGMCGTNINIGELGV